MNYIDYIILFFAALGFLLGFKEGLIRKIIGLIGLILAVFLTIKFYSSFGVYISKRTGFDEYFSKILAAIGIFFCVEIIFAIIKRIIHPFDRVRKLINQILGGMLGLIQIILLISSVLIILDFADYPSNDDKKNSSFYYSVYNALPQATNYLLGKDAIKKIEEFLKEENQ